MAETGQFPRAAQLVAVALLLGGCALATPFGSGQITGSCIEQRGTIRVTLADGKPADTVLDLKTCTRQAEPERAFFRATPPR